MIAQSTNCFQLEGSSNQQKIGKICMIAELTKCPQLEGSSNQPKIGEIWIIAQPTKCPHLDDSSNQQNIGKIWMIAEPTKSPSVKYLGAVDPPNISRNPIRQIFWGCTAPKYLTDGVPSNILGV